MNYKRIHRHYAYTLQGWLKDINGYRVDINSTGVFDIGEDGSSTNYVNKRFGRDLFSSMIQYYQTDYSPISGNNYFNLVSTNSIDLYNGNISAISVGIKDLNPLLKSYRYDKINRIKEMKSAGLNNNVWVTLSNLFGSTYSYDFNGNIDTLIRYDQNGNLLHNIRYTYSADRNRLSSINVTGTGIGSSSYQYDALGNLIRDNNENINVTWNVIGKVKSVQTPNNMLNFAYNPFGQRQIKRTTSDSTYYIHDATGNVMSIYVKDYPKITAKERPIYGSSRLGIMNKEVEFNLTGNLLSKSNSTIGIKEYELCNLLSNVSVVILDRKDCFNSVFKPIAKTYTDYYPFGYPISSRTDNVDYRYGFNGQEGDGEIYGDNKCYSFEFRNYDSRIGRWWGIDELKNQQPNQSTYKAFNNNPILFIDNDGLKEYMTIKFVTKSGTTLTYRMHISYNIMTDGVKYEATSKISDAVWWYENRYFDYEHVVTYVENADGTFTQKGNPVTRIMTETPYKEADGVYFGGNKKGDIQYDFSEYLTDKPSGGFNFVSDDGGASPTRKKGDPNVTTVNITKIIAAFNAMAATPGNLPNLKNDPLAYAKVANLVKSMVEIVNSKIPKEPKIVHYCINCGEKYDKNMNKIQTDKIPTDTITAEKHEKK